MDLKRYFRGPFVAVLVMLLLFFIVFTYANRGTSYTQVDTSKIVSLINSGQVNEAIRVEVGATPTSTALRSLLDRLDVEDGAVVTQNHQ